MNANARTLRELLAQRVGQHQREVRERAHRAATRRRGRPARACAACAACGGSRPARRRCQRGAHGTAEVEPALVPQAPAGGEPGREPAGERQHRRAAARPCRAAVARRKSTSSGSGAPRSSRPAPAPFSSASRRRTSASTSSSNRLHPLRHGLARDLLGQTAALVLVSIAREQPRHQRLRRERAQHPVGEEGLPARRGVRAAQHRHRLPREPAQRRPRRRRAAAARKASRSCSRTASPSGGARSRSAYRLVVLGRVELGEHAFADDRREPEVEEHVERRRGAPAASRSSRRARRAAPRGRSASTGASARVASMSSARLTGRPALRSASTKLDRAVDQPSCSLSRASARLVARAWSLTCLSTTPSVSRTAASSRVSRPSATRVLRPVDASPRSTAPSSAPARAARGRCAPAARPASRDLRHPRQHDRLLALGAG